MPTREHHAPPPKLPLFARKVRYGGDYNPEQWPRETWREDVRLMREAGVDLVTVGVFSWSRLEPEEGELDVSWLLEVLDLLGAAGIGVDLATPTAAPPPWMAARYPETLPVDERGTRYSGGSRQHFCVSSPAYRRLALRIVEALAREVAGHDAVELFHIHNEYACHVPRCYCDLSAAAFRAWLVRRYGDVDALNEAWGTSFWSQRYSSFDEVQPPRATPAFQNPTQVLDFARFSNDEFLEECRDEAEALHRVRPDVPVTTNFMGAFKPLDYFAWARELDLVSTDNYPDPADPDSPMLSAFHYDLIRSLDKSKPWMVMEQAASRVNWRRRNVAKVPGEMRATSYQAIARGADGILFFQWRASRFGAERFHSAMLPHSGEAAPSWREVVGLGRELASLGPLAGTTVEADAALVLSWPSWWAMEEPGGPAADVTLADQVAWMYRPLYERGVTTDVCHPGEPLERYRAVLLPSLYLVTEEEGANLVAYVRQGGTAVISFWSGIADERHHVHPGPYGGPLRPLIGCDVLDVTPLPTGDEVEVEWDDGRRTVADLWVDIAADRDDGTVLARLASGPWSGRPVVVSRGVGDGKALYVGARLDALGLGRVYDRVPALRGAETLAAAGPGVERVVRSGGGVSYEFVINRSGEQLEVPLATPGTELLSGKPVAGTVRLEPKGVAVVRRG